ncbi:MAG: alpha-glucosidase C-terminal domain-containing protein, partial [Oscillibacter sp.]|nr:alpha-glucosidase C-terminal domain-containing protein [Oscillibacter sp.]
TPYIYEGEEIGMTNAGYTDISQYDDVEARNYYQILLDRGVSREDALAVLGARARDNGRTPMQWTGGEYAGFSTAKPWLSPPANYTTVNVEAEEADPDSILHYYRKLVQLRKDYPIIADGDIRFLDTGNERVFAYQRALDGKRLTVVCSFSGQPETAEAESAGEVLISNYGDRPSADGTEKKLSLRPWEAFAVLQ